MEDLNNYEPSKNTFPISFIEPDHNTRIISKANFFWNRVSLSFKNFNSINDIKLKFIFEHSIDKEESPKWTEKQIEWIDDKIDLKKLFTNNLKTIPKINDFKRKFFLRYWEYFFQNKCPI